MYKIGADNLPANVKKLSPVKQRQWVHVWNAAYSKAKGTTAEREASAFKQANGVVETLSRVFPNLSEDWDSYDWDAPSAVAAPSAPSTSPLSTPPTMVRAMLPDDARQVWLTTYNMCAVMGGDRYRCEDAAWQAVDAAGFAPANIEPYVHVPEAASTGTRVGGVVFEAAVHPVWLAEDAASRGTGAVWDVVLITSGISANKRRYQESVLRAAVPLFEGTRAYADHDFTAGRKGTRSIKEVVGWYESATWDPTINGIRAKAHVLETAKWLRDLLLEMTGPAGKPDLIGLSINAYGEQKPVREGDLYISDVTKITSVASVDWVTEPAAGGSVVRLVAGINRDPANSEEDLTMNRNQIIAATKRISDAAARLAFLREDCQLSEEEAQGILTEIATVPPPTATPPTPANPTPTPTPVVVTATESVQGGMGGTGGGGVAVMDPPQAAAPPITAPPVVPLTEIAEFRALQTQLSEMRVSAVRLAIATRMATSRLPVPMRESLQTRFDSLLSRRTDVPDAEIDAMFKESTDLWAALEAQPGGSGSIRGIPAHRSAPTAAQTAAGASASDLILAAIDGMLENINVKVGDEAVPRFNSLKQAYAAVTGISPFDVDPLRMMAETRVSYDSALARSGAPLMESMTTASWGYIFADRLNRRMLQEYRLRNTDDWKKVVSNIENVTDFRTQRRDRLGGYGLLETVAEAQTYPMLTSPSDEEATYALSKRGGLDDITFEMIANDDLRNVRNIPVKLARAAVQTLYRFVFDMIKNGFTTPNIYDGNPLFSNAAHVNIAGGATPAALGDAGLEAGWKAMRLQTAYGNATEVIGIRPKFLVTSAYQEALAWRLCNSAVSILTANYNATEPNFYKGLEPLVVDYWTDQNDWFLIGDPNEIPTIEIGFFNGNEEPELFVQDQPNVGAVMTADKITYKVRHIYSGTILDWRAFVGSNPA